MPSCWSRRRPGRPGWPTRSRRTASSSRPALGCWPATSAGATGLRPATTSISTTAHWARCSCVSSAAKTDLAAAAVSVNGPQWPAKCWFCWSIKRRAVRWLWPNCPAGRLLVSQLTAATATVDNDKEVRLYNACRSAGRFIATSSQPAADQRGRRRGQGAGRCWYWAGGPGPAAVRRGMSAGVG